MREVVIATAAVRAVESGEGPDEAETSVKEGALIRSIFAGKRLFRKTRTFYVKADWAVRERVDPEDREGSLTLIKYPFTVGTKWSTLHGGRRVLFSIEGAGVSAQTRAGRFTGCLKVKSQVSGISAAWKFDYYCPGVGRVLTTVAGPGFENPNTELASFKRP